MAYLPGFLPAKGKTLMSDPVFQTIWAYLWDLVDDGIEGSVDRMKNDIGLDGISVATAYHTYQQLRPRKSGGGKLLIAPEAAVYFQPDASLYADTAIKPHVAPMVSAGNPLAQLANACSAADLKLISWTVCFHTTQLATAYPQFAQQTAYGDNLGWVLCPGCDDVRAYIIALCRDLSINYGVSRLELETCNFGGFVHAHHHVKQALELGNLGTYLMSLSFSDGCVEKARNRGIDIDGLRRWVIETLDGIFATGRPLEGDISECVSSRADLSAFQALREELVTSLAGEISDASGDAEVSFLLMGDRWTAVIVTDRLRDQVDLLEVLAYVADPAEVAASIDAAKAAGADVERMLVGLTPYGDDMDADLLTSLVRQIIASGVSQVSYYNYGMLPEPNLEWIKSCIKATS